MESYIQISKINDYIFCPRSIYLHSVYEDFHTSVYHDTPQIKGKIKHEAVDKGTYSSEKRYILALPVYSEKYIIAGKIDIYDKEEAVLIERKTKISKIYDGYKYQLYAQYLCLLEMGYEVKKLYLHSLEDNKRYEIPLPDDQELESFASVLRSMEEASVRLFPILDNPEKCNHCIYRPLCH